MNLQFNLSSASREFTSSFKEHFLPSLTPLHKKIILIATGILCFIALIFAVGPLRKLYDKYSLDKKLKAAKMAGKDLTELNLAWYGDYLTIERLQDVLKACPNLKKLDLTDCYQITDAIIKDLPRNLENLNLTYCDNLTDNGIKDLPSGLQILNLKGCYLLTNAGIHILPRGLERLYLNRCYKLTDAALEDLPKKLQLISLTGCFKITEAAIKKLKLVVLKDD